MDDVKRKPITVTVPGAGLTVLRSLQKELSDLRVERDRLKAENARLREAADVGFDLASALRTDVSDPKVRVSIALLVAQDETKGSDT